MKRTVSLFALFSVSKDFTEKLQKKYFPNTSVYFLAQYLLNLTQTNLLTFLIFKLFLAFSIIVNPFPIKKVDFIISSIISLLNLACCDTKTQNNA